MGKRLIPPLLDIGPWNEVSWVDKLLPELLWLGLLNAQHGVAAGARVCAEVAKAAEPELKESEKKAFACRTSAFDLFDDEQRDHIRDKLNEADVLLDLGLAISPLCAAYPRCPLAFLAAEGHDVDSGAEKIRTVLPSLFNRWEEPATFVQIHAVYMTFAQGRLFVAEDTSFANFPAVEAYPATEESLRIAAGCRAMVNTFASPDLNEAEDWWPGYFWNRGLELDPCRPMDWT